MVGWLFMKLNEPIRNAIRLPAIQPRLAPEAGLIHYEILGTCGFLSSVRPYVSSLPGTRWCDFNGVGGNRIELPRNGHVVDRVDGGGKLPGKGPHPIAGASSSQIGHIKCRWCETAETALTTIPPGKHQECCNRWTDRMVWVSLSHFGSTWLVPRDACTYARYSACHNGWHVRHVSVVKRVKKNNRKSISLLTLAFRTARWHPGDYTVNQVVDFVGRFGDWIWLL